MSRKKVAAKAKTRHLASDERQSGRRRELPAVIDSRPELNEVDREIIEALTGFRDALRDRDPLERKYTVRQVVVTVPPPPFKPEDVRKTRELLGVSQPVFADFLGTSSSTVRSWEQGQKLPSPMARRLLGFISSDPGYWKSQFLAIVKPRESEPEIISRSSVPSRKLITGARGDALKADSAAANTKKTPGKGSAQRQ